MKKFGIFALAFALLLPLGAASAETIAELAEQAKTPWKETIAAHGRELTFDVTARVPDAAQMGLYRVTCERDEERMDRPGPEYPPKRRGIAKRAKPNETFSPEELDPEYRAFGNPLTAGEAVALAQQWFEPRLERLPGVGLALTEVTGYSPLYLFDKNAQEWLGLAAEGEVGSYWMAYELTFMGAPVEEWRPFFVDADAYYEERAYEDFGCQWTVTAMVEDREKDYIFSMGLPKLEETLAENVELAPLETVLDALRGLVRDGYLRKVESLTLCYHAFHVGERGQEDGGEGFLFKPVWAARCEAYDSPEREAADFFGEVMPSEEVVYIDARTGEWITRNRVANWD